VYEKQILRCAQDDSVVEDGTWAVDDCVAADDSVVEGNSAVADESVWLRTTILYQDDNPLHG
jgi:hypothetical protein